MSTTSNESSRIISYLPEDINEPEDLVAAIRARRGGALLHLDRMLLHSPTLATGWNFFLQQIRSNLLIDMKVRELIMCAVAMINEAEYEFVQHCPCFLAAGGTAEQAAALRQLQQDPFNFTKTHQERIYFLPTELDVIDLTVQMTKQIKVEEALMRRLKEHFGEQQVVELVAVVSTYNMVSRFLVALDIHP